MSKVFLDANVFFAAVKSHNGGSYFVLGLAKRGLIKKTTVAHALAEAEKNIKEKLGRRALMEHYENLLGIRPKIQSLETLTLGLEEEIKDHILDKDIPILAGAILAGADFLITLDKKHLLNNRSLSALNLPFKILTPGDFIQKHL